MFSFFSVWSLLTTIFAPYKRLSERYKGGLDLEDLFGTIVVNLLMRIVGFVLRFILILIGLIFTLLTFIFGFFAFLVWLILPLLIPFIFFASLITIF